MMNRNERDYNEPRVGNRKNKLINLAKMSLLSLALLLPLAGCGSNASSGGASKEGNKDSGIQKLEIKLSHVASDNTPKGLAALKFKEIVEEKSAGKINVKVFPSGQLYGDNDEIEAVQAGNVQIIIPAAAKLSVLKKHSRYLICLLCLKMKNIFVLLKMVRQVNNFWQHWITME